MSEDLNHDRNGDSTKEDLAVFLRKELRRHELSLRELLIAEVILELSNGSGRDFVKIPKLPLFTDITGITVGNVHSTLARLHVKRILDVQLLDGVPCYRITFLTDHWKVAPRISRERIEHALSLIAGFNRAKPDEEEGVKKNREAEFQQSMEASGNFFMTGDKTISAPPFPIRER